MKTPLMMIINPAAGKGGFRRALPDALKMLSDAGYAVTMYFTECRGHATELATQYAGAVPYLWCSAAMVRSPRPSPVSCRFPSVPR